VISNIGAQNVFGLSSGAIIVLQTALQSRTIRKIALFEPPLSIDHSSPTEWLTRFNREVSEGSLPSALATVLKGLQASRTTSALPRFLLVPLLRFAMWADAKNVSPGDMPIQALIPTMHYDVQLVIETESALSRFASVEAQVLLLGGSQSQGFLHVALDALVGILPHARQVEFAGLDHMAADNRGKPEVVATELRRFFGTDGS
jgi:pimeloyl-ACP methyl ester carboxylesterase